MPYDASLQRLAFRFDCGSNSAYNAFLRNPESLDSGYGKTFVFLTDDEEAIIGYYNIGLGELVRSDSQQTLKCGGAVHINYLAVDKHFRGKLAFADEAGDSIYWSDLLLMDCRNRIEELRERYVGFAFITLFSSREGLKLYERNDFETLDDDMSFAPSDEEKTAEGIKMYLPLLSRLSQILCKPPKRSKIRTTSLQQT